MLLTALLFSGSNAQSQEWGKWTSWGDMGDGTYRNPIIPADFSDIDCIKIGKTTMPYPAPCSSRLAWQCYIRATSSVGRYAAMLSAT